MYRCALCKREHSPEINCPPFASKSEPASCSVPETPWQRSLRSFQNADRLEELRLLKLESGCSPEEARAWAEDQMARHGIDVSQRN